MKDDLIMVSGDKVKAFCEKCHEFVQATYSYGDFSFDRGVIAENILRAMCDNCGTVLSVALQSAPLLKETLDTSKLNSEMSDMKTSQEYFRKRTGDITKDQAIQELKGFQSRVPSGEITPGDELP